MVLLPVFRRVKFVVRPQSSVTASEVPLMVVGNCGGHRTVTLTPHYLGKGVSMLTLKQ